MKASSVYAAILLSAGMAVVACASKPPPPKEVVVKPPPPKGFQVLRAPVKIDIKIPEIDLSKAITNENDFSGKGVKGGTGNGVVG